MDIYSMFLCPLDAHNLNSPGLRRKNEDLLRTFGDLTRKFGDTF